MMCKTLYHYCSFDTFNKILDQPQLRFTDITKSNDGLEIRFLWEKYLEFFELKYPKELSTGMLKYEIKNQLSVTHFLAMCFSENSDSLHMWNMYSNGGVALGFNKDKLKGLCAKITEFNNAICLDKTGGNELAKFEKVTYYNEKSVSNYIAEQCKNIVFTTDPFPKIFYDAPFSKTDFWVEEKEWRMVITHFSNDLNIIDLDKLKENGIDIPSEVEMKFETSRNSQLLMCCYIPFDKSILESVIISPNSTVSVEEVEFALKIKGFNTSNIQISKSKGSLK